MTLTKAPITIAPVLDDSPATVDQYAQILVDGFGPGHVSQVINGGRDDVVLARMKMRVYEGVKDLEVYSATAEGDERPGAVLIVAKPGLLWGET